MKRFEKISICLNIIIFILMILTIFWMITGIKFTADEGVTYALTASSFEGFKYFTVDSNVLAGIAALVYTIFLIRISKGRSKQMPHFMYILKLAATACITLTMMVTVCFLAPQYGDDWFSVFRGANMIFHLIIPTMSLATFAFLEPLGEHKFVESLVGVIPMALYGIGYTINIFTHLVDGLPSKECDWYNFLNGNLSNAFISIPAMLLATWVISIVLWALNRGTWKRLSA